ncbi:MAG: hypothetical protein ACE5OW_07075 [Candidatus Bathyarchaeia archaeon]
MVFVVTFLLFLLVTLAFPVLPPDGMVYDLLGIPQTTYVFLEVVPAQHLINGVVNGLVYGFAVWLIFSVGSLYAKKVGEVTVLLECPLCEHQWKELMTKAQLRSMGFPEARTLPRRRCPNCGKFIRPKIVKAQHGIQNETYLKS